MQNVNRWKNLNKELEDILKNYVCLSIKYGVDMPLPSPIDKIEQKWKDYEIAIVSVKNSCDVKEQRINSPQKIQEHKFHINGVQKTQKQDIDSTTFEISESTTSVPIEARLYSNIVSITVHPDNKFFSSKEGILFNKEGTEIIVCPRGKKKPVIPEIVKKVGKSAFARCTKLSEITVPDSVEEIEEYAFERCEKLNAAKLPKSIKEIREGTFRNCENLAVITIPDGIRKIGKLAFENCARLSEVTIPNSVEEIGEYAFSGCKNLHSFDTPNYGEEVLASSDIGVWVKRTNVEEVKSLNELYEKLSKKFEGYSNNFPHEIPVLTESERAQKLIITLDDKQEHKILENYNFWNNQKSGIQGKQNIFKNISHSDFFRMIQTADFSQLLNRKSISQRVKYNICILSRELGNDWGEQAAKNIGATLQECQKRTGFPEHEKLKDMFK
ncbi:MAG: leucine-rich repeat domain-containing protein [Lentimicrobiaceae bacterium]|nr:leucine-rich repeat domain-containing protein [Lentimicrobiaceae bacterium]